MSDRPDEGVSGAEAEIAIGVIVAAFSIVGTGAFRRGEQQRKDTGQRIGRLERFVDFERGRQAGIREESRRRGRGK